jgi:hypothetical protein
MPEPQKLSYRNPRDEAAPPAVGQIIVGIFFLILTACAGGITVMVALFTFGAVVDPLQSERRGEAAGAGVIGLLVFIVATKVLYRITRRQFEKPPIVNEPDQS